MACPVQFLCKTVRNVGLVLFYYVFSIGITFYNKWLMKVSPPPRPRPPPRLTPPPAPVCPALCWTELVRPGIMYREPCIKLQDAVQHGPGPGPEPGPGPGCLVHHARSSVVAHVCFVLKM